MSEEKRDMLEFLKILIRRNQLDDSILTEALKYLGAKEYVKETPSIAPEFAPGEPSKKDKERTLEFLKSLLKNGVLTADDLIELLRIVVTKREEKPRIEDEPVPYIGDDPEPRPFRM